MIYDKLVCIAEMAGQGLFPAGSVKCVFLFDFYPRQSPALFIEVVAQAREFLFFGKQLFAGFHLIAG